MNSKKSEKHLDEIPLDDYEQELENALERGEFVSDPDFEKNKKIFEKAARRYKEDEKRKSITLRIKEKDLIRLKTKAMKNNIPYQSLINLLINSYTEGRTKLTL